MKLPEFLQMDHYGDINLTGHRIGLYHLVYYYNEGYSPEMLLGQFPTLPLALIHKVIAFYLENKSDVDAYVADYRSELEKQRAANPKRVDVAALRKRLEDMQRAQATNPQAKV